MFQFEGLPRLICGSGAWSRIFELVQKFGRRILLVTGGESFRRQGLLESWQRGAKTADLLWDHAEISGEPGPDWVDAVVQKYAKAAPDVVLAVGGGSAIDAGKAVAAMLPIGEPVTDYLEGVGTRTHPGLTLPLMAVPTTAGTGAEATKNAVLSRIGPGGFKKSLRHDRLIPKAVLIDPLLHISCPASVTAACGLDAFTQLLEGYTSPNASPLTDALAWKGLELAAGNLLPVCTDKSGDPDTREAMALAAFLSGAVLAHAGLGIVHGLASPLGGRYAIPHGVICGTLLAEATHANVSHLMAHAPDSPALRKYAQVGQLLGSPGTGHEAAKDLVKILRVWCAQLQMPRLSTCGVEMSELENLAKAAGLKTNPAPLSTEQVLLILQQRF